MGENDPGVDALTLAHCAHGIATCISDTGLYIREAPTLSAKKLALMPTGAVSWVWAVIGSWALVMPQDGTLPCGWCARQFLGIPKGLIP